MLKSMRLINAKKKKIKCHTTLSRGKKNQTAHGSALSTRVCRLSALTSSAEPVPVDYEPRAPSRGSRQTSLGHRRETTPDGETVTIGTSRSTSLLADGH